MAKAQKPKTVIVWDPDGNPVETSPLNARDLLNHCGYSGHDPSAKPSADARLDALRMSNDGDPILEQLGETPEKTMQDVVDAVDGDTPDQVDDEDEDDDDDAPVAVDEMDKDALVEYADKTFAVQLDKRKGVDKLREEVAAIQKDVAS